MELKKIDSIYIVTLNEGEEIIKTLTKFCDEKINRI